MQEPRRELEVRDLGVISYEAGYQLQKDLVEARRDNQIMDQLVLLEHPPVYTYGRKTDLPPLVEGADVFEVERGGEVTYHNPGQLVAYPILQLADGERDLHAYLRNLEEVILGVLGDFELKGDRRTGYTGVWVEGGRKKIASIGIAVRGWVTYHGIAPNPIS